MLTRASSYMSCCAFNFGYDVGSFSGVQAMQSFASQFGEYHDDTELYALPAWLSSVMTATPFIGKAIVNPANAVASGDANTCPGLHRLRLDSREMGTSSSYPWPLYSVFRVRVCSPQSLRGFGS